MFQILQIFVCTLSVESFNDVFDGVDPNSRVLRLTPDEEVWDTVVFVLDEVEYAVMPGSLEIKSARRPIWKIRFNPLNYIIRGIARGGCGGGTHPPPPPPPPNPLQSSGSLIIESQSANFFCSWQNLIWIGRGNNRASDASDYNAYLA
jgi:hypothetical protein